MTKIPKFQTLEEASEFWDTHDFEDYLDDTEPDCYYSQSASAQEDDDNPSQFTGFRAN